MFLPSRFLRCLLAFAAVAFPQICGAQTVVRVLHYDIHRDVGGNNSGFNANAAAGYPAMRGLVSAQVNLPGAVEQRFDRSATLP